MRISDGCKRQRRAPENRLLGDRLTQGFFYFSTKGLLIQYCEPGNRRGVRGCLARIVWAGDGINGGLLRDVDQLLFFIRTPLLRNADHVILPGDRETTLVQYWAQVAPIALDACSLAPGWRE